VWCILDVGVLGMLLFRRTMLDQGAASLVLRVLPARVVRGVLESDGG